MEEVNIAGKWYISSKRAEKITGYTHDYLGQLCRGGKLSCKRIGRSWYISEDGVFNHKKAYKRDQNTAQQNSYRGKESHTHFTYTKSGAPLTPQVNKETGRHTKSAHISQGAPHAVQKKEKEYTLAKMSPYVTDMRGMKAGKKTRTATAALSKTQSSTQVATEKHPRPDRKTRERVTGERRFVLPRISIATGFTVLVIILVAVGTVTFEGVVTYEKGKQALHQTFQMANLSQLLQK